MVALGLRVALLILAARLREIHLYTGDVGINDQWKIEAADLYAPWLAGTLSPWAFLQPHFEHVPVWTRLLGWSEVALSGQWDPLLQATVNSLLYAGFAALWLRWLARTLRPLACVCLTAVVAACGMLSHGWENTTWGFQSQFPFALIFLLVHADGSFRHPAGSAGWWRAQAAGLAGLFTLASMWMAPLAVVLVSLWIQPRGPRLRLIPLLTAGVGLSVLAAVRVAAPPGGAFAQTAGSPLHFLHALLDLLGWPTAWPGALVLMNLPLLIYALQLRGRADCAASDRTNLALGVWALGQAAALAFARSADYSGYVSRYGDLLAVGLLANGFALARLAEGARGLRRLTAAFALCWGLAAIGGLYHLSHSGHAAYFHENAVIHARIRREAVQAYLSRGDRSLLERTGTRYLIYQDVNQVTSLLDQPAFRALLPRSVNPGSTPSPAGNLVRWALEHWYATGIAGAWLAVLGLSISLRPKNRDAASRPMAIQPEPCLQPLAALLGLGAFALLFQWTEPFNFTQAMRWRHLFLPPGSVGPLDYEFFTPAPFPASRLQGGAPLSPPDLRDLFCGTAPEGPGFTGTVLSSRFTITTPWLVVPCAGYPVSHGNGLRIRIEDAAGHTLTEVAHPGPNPPEISFWTADVRQYAGMLARLVLYDGRTETEAWVAAAPPIATADPTLAARLAERLRLERLAPAHRSLGWIALTATLLLTGSMLLRLRARGG